MFILTLDNTQQRARSLSYAKALAPQMFQRAGTQKLFRSILVTNEATGEQVASYGRLGWRDETVDGAREAVWDVERSINEQLGGHHEHPEPTGRKEQSLLSPTGFTLSLEALLELPRIHDSVVVPEVVLDCPGCDGYRPADKEYCTLRCKLDDQRRRKAEQQFAGNQFDTWEEKRGEV